MVVGLFKSIRQRKKSKKTGKDMSYEDGVRAGSFIGNIVTNVWNSQKKPGKVYIRNRRVHHGEVGVLLGLSGLFKRQRPDATGILSGLGDALSQDDIADKEEWFKFKKRAVPPSSVIDNNGTAESVNDREPRSNGGAK
jgi:hypothetical protein